MDTKIRAELGPAKARDRRTARCGFRKRICVRPSRLPAPRRILRRALRFFGGRPAAGGSKAGRLGGGASLFAQAAGPHRRAERSSDEGRLPFVIFRVIRGQIPVGGGSDITDNGKIDLVKT